jgi:chondroitin AC lyase
VIGGEVVNSENMSGYHLADGALFVYGSGREYEDIQPVWDWQKIPGTTALQLADGPPRMQKRYQIASDFVGGASDGRSGCAAIDFVRDGLHARKAYFFLGDTIACLGAAVQTDAEATAPVTTTINQCLLAGEVWAGDAAAASKLARGEHRLHPSGWLWHDGVGYVLLGAAGATARLAEQRGSWRKVEDKPAISTAELHRDVLLLTIEHGARPQAGQYAYLMLPRGLAPAAMPSAAATPGVRVLANSAQLQAVAAASGDEVQAVFYEPGTLDCGRWGQLAVDQPCLAVLKGQNKTARLTLADPTQKLREIGLPRDHRQVALPQDGEAGSSVSIDLPERRPIAK